jgi:hypothetical protein
MRSGQRSARAPCLKCHHPGGDAEESKFVLHDPAKQEDAAEALRHNRAAFEQMAKIEEREGSRLLLKASGGLDHEGEEVLKPDSTGYRVLAEFVRRATAPASASPSAPLRFSTRCSRFL